MKESVVGKNKHSMSITKLKDKTEIRESIEKLFAPNLRKETKLVQPIHIIHGLYMQ